MIDIPSRFQIQIFSNYVKHIAEKTICRIFTLDYEKDSSNGSKYFTRIFANLKWTLPINKTFAQLQSAAVECKAAANHHSIVYILHWC